MPKHYKEVVEDIINKMNEAKAMGGKFIVRMKRPGQNTVSAIFDTKAQADAYEKEKKKLGFQIEEAPANAVGDGGNVALPPKHEPGVKNKRKEIDPLMYAKPLKRKIKESDDNNNVVLRGVIEKIENIEQKLDEKIHGKTEFKIEDKEEYKTFKDKYNG